MAPSHLVPRIERRGRLKSIPYLENGVCLHASALFAAPGSTALLRARLVHVCVTEYDRATSNYLDPLHARKVARAIERQLKPIAARSLLKAASDLAPRALPQTVDQLKVSWV